MNTGASMHLNSSEQSDTLGALKAAMRAQVLGARDALAPGERLAQSQACIAQLFTLSDWESARCVAAYASFGSELETSSLLGACVEAPRRLALPRIQRVPEARLSLHWVDDLDELVSGPWGIREPRPEAPSAALRDIDCVIVPGVAFDRAGNRLGYGKGFYDRLLHARDGATKVIALALECQLVDALPHGERDECIDILVTPNGTWRFDK